MSTLEVKPSMLTLQKHLTLVYHNKLIYKLYLCGIRGSLLLWIKHFFSQNALIRPRWTAVSDFTNY